MLNRAAVLPLLALLVACGPKVPPPPPEFTDPARTPTGQSRLEDAILDAVRIEGIEGRELVELQTRARKEFAADADISDYVKVLVGQDEVAMALQFLHERAWKAVDDQSKGADSLGFAMGQLRWSVCAQMARDYLSLTHSTGAFLVRGLCLERAGEHAAAVENVRAAPEILAIDPAWIDLALEVMEQRSSSGPMPAGDPKVFDELMLEAKQLDSLSRLFVHTLMGIPADPPLGSLDPGRLTYNDIRTVLASRARSYRHCYHVADAESSRKNHIEGRAVIEFEIDSLGRLANPQPVLVDWKDHPKGSELNGCLMEQLSRLRFPRPAYGLRQLSRHEFSFRPD